MLLTKSDCYFELESSGLRDEIRYHYMHSGRPRTEALPYRLADGQWHRVALSVSASHLLLHIDCNRVCLLGIYERVIDPPETNLPPGSNLWLGQRNQKHGLFKGIIQDGKIIFMPNGYITQCPNLNRNKCLNKGKTEKRCRFDTVSILDLQAFLEKMAGKLLDFRETGIDTELPFGLVLEKFSSQSDTVPRVVPEFQTNLQCTAFLLSAYLRTAAIVKSGAVECRRMSCPPLNCSPDSLPVHIAGQCCKVCRPKCIYGGKVLAEGQRILSKSCQECRGGVLVKITEACPLLNCSEKDHILPENQCCSVCRGEFVIEMGFRGFQCNGDKKRLGKEARNEKVITFVLKDLNVVKTQSAKTGIPKLLVSARMVTFLSRETLPTVKGPVTQECGYHNWNKCCNVLVTILYCFGSQVDQIGLGWMVFEGPPYLTEKVDQCQVHSIQNYASDLFISLALSSSHNLSHQSSLNLFFLGNLSPSFSLLLTYIDECAAKMHYCHANTVCVNLPGLYRCDCVPGYIRVDDFSCTEHDDCGSGQHNCDENAICTNTVQGHSCTCKPGYVGNGTICRAFLDMVLFMELGTSG
ncbi:hypothetical protein MJG53_016680 [Ovis ammon polii x Ovis aries]|uniref:Uncharacterized protein n=1 Tax=Ovis ammon polii x Ovis aries TaxID=2918886 RepID=A0ACB9U904_9CETA|nr:hypothetical protein MJG53_016680 [Ovis ammon polii x Ovis aries]